MPTLAAEVIYLGGKDKKRNDGVGQAGWYSRSSSLETALKKGDELVSSGIAPDAPRLQPMRKHPMSHIPV